MHIFAYSISGKVKSKQQMSFYVTCSKKSRRNNSSHPSINCWSAVLLDGSVKHFTILTRGSVLPQPTISKLFWGRGKQPFSPSLISTHTHIPSYNTIKYFLVGVPPSEVKFLQFIVESASAGELDSQPSHTYSFSLLRGMSNKTQSEKQPFRINSLLEKMKNSFSPQSQAEAVRSIHVFLLSTQLSTQ